MTSFSSHFDAHSLGLVGWHSKEIVDRLEEKRKVKAGAYFERKVRFRQFVVLLRTNRTATDCQPEDTHSCSQIRACRSCTYPEAARSVRLLDVFVSSRLLNARVYAFLLLLGDACIERLIWQMA